MFKMSQFPRLLHGKTQNTFKFLMEKKKTESKPLCLKCLDSQDYCMEKHKRLAVIVATELAPRNEDLPSQGQLCSSKINTVEVEENIR